MKKNLLIAAVTLILGTIIGGSIVTEASSITNQSSHSESLSLSPSRLQFGILEPGNRYTETFTIQNTSDDSLSISLSAIQYWVANEHYDIDYSAPNSYNQLAEWITFSDGESYTLDPDESLEASVRVSVPSGVTEGGQYALVAINMMPVTNEVGGGMQVAESFLVPVYSAVQGDLVYKGELVDRHAVGFSFDPVIASSSTVENFGNVDFDTSYKFTVRSLFGDNVVYEIENTEVILPETKRLFEQKWEDAPMLGIYRTTQEITYVNQDGESITDVYGGVSIICPIWLLITLLVIIVVVVVLIIVKRKHSKKSR